MNHLLCFSASEDGRTIEVNMSLDGLNLLLKHLSQLKSAVEGGENDHVHLFSAAWGGDELAWGKTEEELNPADKVTLSVWHARSADGS